MSNIATLQSQAREIGSASKDPAVKQLSEVVAGLCAEMERIERTANEAISEAK
jgi:hypothetical protein